MGFLLLFFPHFFNVYSFEIIQRFIDYFELELPQEK